METSSSQEREVEQDVFAGQAYEKETIINFNNAEKAASYYTLNFHKRKELLELAEKYPEQVKIVSDNGEAIEALLPKCGRTLPQKHWRDTSGNRRICLRI